jgi:hydroxymethylbilane synthase
VRHDPREALVGPATLAALPLRARIGTSSLRRSSQIHFLRPDLEVVPLRGNVPTRVDKVHGTQGSPSTLDAALLAVAGLERLGLDRFIAARLDPIDIMPAPGQGALGLEVRADDRAARDSLHVLDHPASAAHVAAERALLAALGGGCQAPVAAYAGTNPDRLFGRVAAADGSVQLTASATLDPRHPAAAGVAVAHLLTAQGAGKLLAR